MDSLLSALHGGLVPTKGRRSGPRRPRLIEDFQVTGGSIFKILAGIRKALKCPHENDLVNSASAATGTRRYVSKRTYRVDPAAYAYDRSEIWFENHVENGRRVTVVRYPNQPLSSIWPHLSKESGKGLDKEYAKWVRENFESLLPVEILKQ
ncbi:hypothetical protein HanIR_Chr10g0498201 [Helianthus annuus]|nr:hypothetical protein HanIR_Chr10g0498201 [Helianthus annuus]